jgi:hypothetical protein
LGFGQSRCPLDREAAFPFLATLPEGEQHETATTLAELSIKWLIAVSPNHGLAVNHPITKAVDCYFGNHLIIPHNADPFDGLIELEWNRRVYATVGDASVLGSEFDPKGILASGTHKQFTNLKIVELYDLFFDDQIADLHLDSYKWRCVRL